MPTASHSGGCGLGCAQVVKVVKDAVTSYGASVVPFGDSALIEVPLPSGETPGLFIVLNTNRKHHCRLAALLTALQEISNLVPSHPQQPRSKHAAEATSLEATSLSPVAPQLREVIDARASLSPCTPLPEARGQVLIDEHCTQ